MAEAQKAIDSTGEYLSLKGVFIDQKGYMMTSHDH